MALIDLAAILPLYLPLFFTVDLRRLQLLRLLKVIRYSESLRIFTDVYRLNDHRLKPMESGGGLKVLTPAKAGYSSTSKSSSG